MGTRKTRTPVRHMERQHLSTALAAERSYITAVNSYTAGATLTVPGMVVLASSDATASTYTLPTSTAGTRYEIYFSSGPDSGAPAASRAGTCIVCADASNTKIASILSTEPANQKRQQTVICGTTGDHCTIVAQSSSQWNIVSYSTGLATSSG